MTKRWNLLWKKAAPLLAGGMLLQAGGCTIDTTTLLTGWLTAIANDIITGFVFRNFNLIT
jgi:hypothetical protein